MLPMDCRCLVCVSCWAAAGLEYKTAAQKLKGVQASGQANGLGRRR